MWDRLSDPAAVVFLFLVLASIVGFVIARPWDLVPPSTPDEPEPEPEPEDVADEPEPEPEEVDALAVARDALAVAQNALDMARAQKDEPDEEGDR